VVSGIREPNQPSNLAGDVAARLPNGRYLEFGELDHFGPMTHPVRIAELVTDLVATLV
jgi:hypothetical protein